MSGSTSSVTMLKPTVDNGSASMGIATRRLLNETITYTSQTAADAENRIALRSIGRYHRLQLTPTGSWTSVVGFDMDINKLGSR